MSLLYTSRSIIGIASTEHVRIIHVTRVEQIDIQTSKLTQFCLMQTQGIFFLFCYK